MLAPYHSLAPTAQTVVVIAEKYLEEEDKRRGKRVYKSVKGRHSRP